VSRCDPADLRVRRRLDQISDRLDELRARSLEMSGLAASPGPGPGRLAHAAQRASEARGHAMEAARLARIACLRSARAHDRAADLYDELAGAGTGDVTRYRLQADRHRALAATDRTAARCGDAA
jgi:hypothetical protein